MNFWNKNGESKKPNDESHSESTNLLDVSNIDIPESDRNDQYQDDIFNQKQKPFPAFSIPNIPDISPKFDISNQTNAFDDEYQLPPVTEDDSSFDDEYQLPPVTEDDSSFDDEYQLPPVTEDDSSFDDEYQLPPVTEDDSSFDDEYQLPPVTEDDSSFDDEYQLPPVAEDDTTFDDEYQLPPVAEDDTVFDDGYQTPTVEEDDTTFDDEYQTPIVEEEDDDTTFDDGYQTPMVAEENDTVFDDGYQTPIMEEDDDTTFDDEYQTPMVAEENDTVFDDEYQLSTNNEMHPSLSTNIDNTSTINSSFSDDNKKEENQSIEPVEIQVEKDTSTPKPSEQKTIKEILPFAQAPRSKTFIKQEEPLPEENNSNIEEDNSDENSSKISTPQIGEDLEYIHYSNPLFLKKLFANGNTCITASGATFQLKDDLRSLLALFSNGRYFVSETYKYDGKVLSFEYLAKKRHLQIGKPEYVPMNVLSTIYEYAAQNTYTEDTDETNEKPDVVEQAQARMQRDFITIISRAAAMHVSDIHIVVAENTIVMFRVNGLMQTEMEYKKEWGESFVRAAFASADISDANYAQNEYQAAQKLGRTPLRGSHGKLVLPRNILGIRLQFNPIAFGTRYVVLRLLYAEENMETTSALEALGFTKKDTDDFYKLRGMPTGITIISGPTGSGKSTTLQRNMIAMLQERNYEVNLITVEDPPEYPIPGARQMPVTNATIEEAKEREFTKALAAALRSDPDSMMIGEVRTLSAADLAFRAALSGHNVWTTLHANNAPAILIRLKDMGVEEFKLKDPEIIKGLTAQRLFRRLCPHCRIPSEQMLNSPIVQRLREGFGDIALETTYLRGPGCKHCEFKGVKGRIAVSEIILPDATFLDLMMKGDTVKATNYWINELNGTTLRESALRHMFNGIIDVGEVERWTGFLNQTITG